MTRDQIIRQAKAILASAYEEAAELIVLYLETHPGEKLQPLCQEIDPDNWNALRNRVQRAQAARESSNHAGSERAPTLSPVRIRDARSSIKKDAGAVVDALDEDSRESLQRALDQTHPATSIKPPSISSEHRKYGLAAEAAGPLARIKKGHEDLAAIWDRYAEEASDEEREAVANALSLASAATFTISMVGDLQ